MRPTWLAVVLVLGLVPRAARPQGTPLGPEFRVNTSTINTQGFSSVAVDASGNFVVVWSGLEGVPLNFDIFAQRYAASGAPLGGEFRVNTYATSAELLASVAAGASGNFVVVWEGFGQDGSKAGVFGQRYDASGAPLGPEFRVNTYTTQYQYRPSVAADTSGNFIVVWDSYGQDGSSFGVFGQRYDAGGAPMGPEFRVNSYTTNDQRDPDIAADASGNFVVTWYSEAEDGSGLGVFGQRYAASGAPLGPEFRVNTYTTEFQRRAAVAADPSGNFVVVWSSKAQDGSSYGVFGQRYASSGAPLGPEFRVNTYTYSAQWDPSVSADWSGNFVVVWSSLAQKGVGYGVFGQRYAADGAPLGGEFRVNTYAYSTQFHPDVAADPSGHFVVLWDSTYQDGSSYGVFGQRFGPIVPVEMMHVQVE